MSMQAIAAICICGCLFSLLLRQYQRPLAVLLGLAVCSLILIGILPQVQEILHTAEMFFEKSSLSKEYFCILCKAVGISYLTQLGMNFCRDCGEMAISSAVELSGRISLILLSLPLFSALAEIVLEVIG